VYCSSSSSKLMILARPPAMFKRASLNILTRDPIGGRGAPPLLSSSRLVRLASHCDQRRCSTNGSTRMHRLHTHTHMHTHAQTAFAHTCACTHAHVYTHTHTHARARAYTYMYIIIFTNTQRTHTHTYAVRFLCRFNAMNTTDTW
jgi:hypothetical protein